MKSLQVKLPSPLAHGRLLHTWKSGGCQEGSSRICSGLGVCLEDFSHQDTKRALSVCLLVPCSHSIIRAWPAGGGSIHIKRSVRWGGGGAAGLLPANLSGQRTCHWEDSRGPRLLYGLRYAG